MILSFRLKISLYIHYIAKLFRINLKIIMTFATSFIANSIENTIGLWEKFYL